MQLSDSMKAVVQTRYGRPGEVLEVREVPRPEPGQGEVLVRVRAASVHPDVWHVVTGRPFFLRLVWAGVLRPKEVIPGTDLAGEVAVVGPGVSRFSVGDAVFGESFEELQWKNGGTFAEYVTVPEGMLAPKPSAVSFEQAATVPSSGIIALMNLRAGRVQPGYRVLVNGAGGGVGTIAVQLSKAWGAHVTGVDRAEKLELVRSLGADRVIDYAREDFTRGSERYDLVFDVASNLSLGAARRVLGESGVYVFVGHDHYGRKGRRVLGSLPRAISLMLRARFDRNLPGPGSPLPGKRECMAALGDLLEAGKLTPVVARTYPLEQVPEAIRDLAEGNRPGRILITP